MYKKFFLPVNLLLTYGYLALFIWSVLEGEIGLMLSGWLASKHLVFEYQKVILIAIIGAFIGDLSIFGFGRLFESKAKQWLNKNPKKEEKIKFFLNRFGSFAIVFERFIYGTHIPMLLVISISGYSFFKFLFFDIIGVVLWAFTFVSIGYFLGEKTIEIIILFQKNIVIISLILFVIFIIWIVKKS